MAKHLSTKEIAAQLIKDLKDAGFEILRYDAFGTKSIYLKLDYGVAGSIRISDHQGKKHLKYSFEVRTDIKQSNLEGDKRIYCKDDLAALVDDCITLRDDRLMLWGTPTYNHYVKLNIERGKTQQGFWQKARLV